MKKDYMTRLARWARWMLPRQEAEDVIDDYRDIVGNPPRPYAELLRDVGKPRDVVAPLATLGVYRIWLAVFAVMAACILIPGVSPLPGMWRFWTFCFYLRFYDLQLGVALAFLGIAVALVWFRWQGHREPRLPRAIPILLAAVLAWTVAVLLVNWIWMRNPTGFAEIWGEAPVYVLFGLVRIGPPGATMPRSVQMLQTALEYGGFAMALAGLYGLVRAKTDDRRWIAVYVLGMMSMLVCMCALAYMTNMDLPDPIPADWWVSCFQTWLIYAGIGVVGAGVALC